MEIGRVEILTGENFIEEGRTYLLDEGDTFHAISENFKVNMTITQVGDGDGKKQTKIRVDFEIDRSKQYVEPIAGSFDGLWHP